MRRQWLLIGVMVLLVALAGCSSITGGDGDGGSADWCSTGTYQNIDAAGGGGQGSASVEGVVDRNGQDMCHVQWESSNAQGTQYASADYYFTEGGDSWEVIYYDENGDRAGSFSSSGVGDSTDGVPSSGDDGMPGGSGDDGVPGGSGDDGMPGGSGDDGVTVSPGDWCAEGTVPSRFANTGTGEEVTVTLGGVVDRNGQQMCQVTYDYSSEANAQYGGMEIYWTENSEEWEVIYLDENGNEIQSISSSSGS